MHRTLCLFDYIHTYIHAATNPVTKSTDIMMHIPHSWDIMLCLWNVVLEQPKARLALLLANPRQPSRARISGRLFIGLSALGILLNRLFLFILFKTIFSTKRQFLKMKGINLY